MKLRKKLGLLKKKRGQLIKLFNEIIKKNRTSKKTQGSRNKSKMYRSESSDRPEDQPTLKLFAPVDDPMQRLHI